MKQFHGYQKKHSFFEGWYLKHQTATDTLALIPAYHIDNQGNASASLQVITNTRMYLLPFSKDEFHASTNQFYVTLGNSVFSRKGIHLDIDTEDLSLCGDISYSAWMLPGTDIMGPFRYIPWMQCNHGVLSLTHRVNGCLTLNHTPLSFEHSLGYVEKDWGSSFPKNYLWTSCSWTDQKSRRGCCIMVSIADIPFAGTHFTGCIGSILYRGREYRLATYCGVRILEYTDQEVVLRQRDLLLHINLIKPAPLSLAAPSCGSMTRTIHESPSCQVRYQFFIRHQKIFDILSSQAGFESS